MLNKLLLIILKLCPKDVAHKILFYKYMGKKLNLNNPKTLNEKIHWLIIYYYGQKEAKLTDKHQVKDYVNSLKIENLIVPKTYFTISDATDIDINSFPDKFVLKCNHGSGDVFICRDKMNFDMSSALKKLTKLKKEDFSNKLLEYHYSYIEPLIMVEELLDDNKNLVPLDYKFFCYNGYVDSVMVCSERGDKTKIDFFDKDGNHLDYSKKEKWSNQKIVLPDNLKLMFEIASKLSRGFPFVRVDLYNIQEKIYFGELTFTPAAGLSTSYNETGDKHLGSFLDIEKLKKKRR